jgi:hypothetical protein
MVSGAIRRSGLGASEKKSARGRRLREDERADEQEPDAAQAHTPASGTTTDRRGASPTTRVM